jgi:hypothetical protein
MAKKEKTITLTKSELQEILFQASFIEFDSHDIVIDQLYWGARSYLQLMDVTQKHRIELQTIIAKLVQLQAK